MDYRDKVLGVDESTDDFMGTGNYDVLIKGLTSGSVILQYLLPPSVENPTPGWEDWPSSEGEFTEDGWYTVFMSEFRVSVRLTGSSNNAGVYVRLGRGLTN